MTLLLWGGGEDTYGASDLCDLGALLVSDIFDHVVGEQAHCKVVVAANHAREDRDASHCEENILHNLSAVHI